MRPPSVPLAVRSPYLSTWLPATTLVGATPQFWDGSPREFLGLARITQQLLDRDVAYINDTPSLVPYGDRYHTSTGVEIQGIQAHPTLGAVYALLAARPA